MGWFFNSKTKSFETRARYACLVHLFRSFNWIHFLSEKKVIFVAKICKKKFILLAKKYEKKFCIMISSQNILRACISVNVYMHWQNEGKFLPSQSEILGSGKFGVCHNFFVILTHLNGYFVVQTCMYVFAYTTLYWRSRASRKTQPLTLLQNDACHAVGGRVDSGFWRRGVLGSNFGCPRTEFDPNRIFKRLDCSHKVTDSLTYEPQLFVSTRLGPVDLQIRSEWRMYSLSFRAKYGKLVTIVSASLEIYSFCSIGQSKRANKYPCC